MLFTYEQAKKLISNGDGTWTAKVELLSDYEKECLKNLDDIVCEEGKHVFTNYEELCKNKYNLPDYKEE